MLSFRTNNSPNTATPNQQLFGSRYRVFFICLTLVTLLVVLTWTIVARTQNRLIEFKSLQIANVVASQATAARSVYSNSVVAKLATDGFKASTESQGTVGSVPIPAQFLKDLAHKSTEKSDGLYGFRPLSLWNLNPDQGLKDNFQHWGWQKLSEQNKGVDGTAIDWQPVWRIEDMNGKKTLRYLFADPASNNSCVNCHNEMEKLPATVKMREAAGVETGKVWKPHELMGALEVLIPLDQSSEFANTQTKDGLRIILVVTFIGLIIVITFTSLDTIRTNSMTNELEYRASHDFLTTLPNRLGFENFVTTILENESFEQNTHIVMLLDLDDFKRINDTLGHEVGDEVLKEAARRLQKVLHSTDIIARLGGDEFAVFLPESDKARSVAVAQQLATTFDDEFSVNGYRLRSGASIGIALMPENGKNTKEALRCADVAMYQAKSTRSDYVWYDPDQDKNHISTLSIINDFRHALKQDELSLQYQPKFNIKLGTIEGVEALLRWEHPELGMVAPMDIVPIAERCGLIAELTRSILKTALLQTKKWHQQGYNFSTAVNLSTQMLNNLDTVALIKNALQETGVVAEKLVIEVTESAMMTDPDCAREILQQLSDLGIRVSIDDYGTGYSSLTYINDLPIDELKLDRSFIKKLRPDSKNAVVVKSTITLAHDLNLSIVAEGVEDEQTLNYLSSIGCDTIQGYYFSRPQTAETLDSQLPQLIQMAKDACHIRPDLAA